MSYPFDWYWTVATNPTQRWAGARGIYVDTSDGAYVTWLAASADNIPTPIDTEANLWDVISQIALSVYLGGQGYGTETPDGASSHTLTNPLKTVYIYEPAAGAQALTLPYMNLPTSRPIGVPLYFINLSTTNAYTVLNSVSGNTVVPVSTIVTLFNGTGGFSTPNGIFGNSKTRAPIFSGTVATLAYDTDGTLANNSDAYVATQKAVKTYADTGLALKANLASPTFTGTPAAPTAAVDTNSTQLATTAMVLAQAASATPLVDGSATVGTSTRYARGDHVHPTVTLTAGAGLTGGGDLSANRTFTVGTGTGLTVNADDVALTVPVAASLGGTGVVNNVASTITISGSFGTTFTVSGTTGVTLPTSGTLSTLAGSEELTNKTLTSSVGKGTWTASGTWTLPAFTLGGTISGGAQQINNVIIGTSTPLAGSFTSLTATAAGALALTNNSTPTITFGASGNVDAKFLATGTAGRHLFYNGGGLMMIMNGAATAVNYMTMQASASGGGVSVSASGGDTDVAFNFSSAGAGIVGFYTSSFGAQQVRFDHTASATRALTLTGSNGGNPTIGATAGNVAVSTGIVGAASVAAHAATAIPAGGTAGAGLLVSSTANFGIFFGSSAPTLSAAKGSLYLRSDGTTTNDRAYINTNGTTTWTALTTVA